MHIGVREFKDRRSDLLNPAEAGEEIVVTSLGLPVTRLGAVAPFAPAGPAEAPRRLRSQGWLRPSNGQPIHAVPEPVPTLGPLVTRAIASASAARRTAEGLPFSWRIGVMHLDASLLRHQDAKVVNGRHADHPDPG